MTERVLTERELNRALLARQLLLERRAMPIPRALERLGGIQMQYAPSGYLGLWSRLEGMARHDLTTALERRLVVQGTLQRVTIHLTSPRDFAVFAAGISDARRTWWLRSHPGLDAGAMETAAARVRDLLRDGPQRRRELAAAIGADAAVWNGVGLWVDLLRVPPSGTWDQRRADLYGLAEDVLPSAGATPEEAVEAVIERYLGGFGPASARDIAGWAGLPLSDVAAVLPRLTLRRFRDERGQALVDLPRAPLPPADTPAPVRFLPTFDATLLVHQRRTQILPDGSARWSSARRPRTRSRRSSSTAGWPGPGRTPTDACGSPRSNRCRAPTAATSPRRPSGSSPSSPDPGERRPLARPGSPASRGPLDDGRRSPAA